MDISNDKQAKSLENLEMAKKGTSLLIAAQNNAIKTMSK